MKTRRYDAQTLTALALADANEQQRAKMEIMFKNGFQVMKIIGQGSRIAINLAANDVSGWLCPDGIFYRPVKGKKRVSINTRTLEVVR